MDLKVCKDNPIVYFVLKIQSHVKYITPHSSPCNICKKIHLLLYYRQKKGSPGTVAIEMQPPVMSNRSLKAG